MAAVNTGPYYRAFIYIRALPSQPCGLYENARIAEQVAAEGFALEEFGLFQGRPIERAQYDDGATIIDGNIVQLNGQASLRVRYITPYNLIIAPHESPINNNQFDQTRNDILNRILRGEATIEELADAVRRLPRREYYG